MADELQVARDYLLPPIDTFWSWRDDGQTIAWADGRTITFREELQEVLSVLAPQGLPALGGVLMLLAATRNNWGQIPDDPDPWVACLDWYGTDSGSGQSLRSALEPVHGLEDELRSPLAAKKVLAEVVFEDVAERSSPEEAEIILRHLTDGIAEVLNVPHIEREYYTAPPWEVVREITCLLDSGVRRLDPDSLRLRAQTGLDALPGSADVELPFAQRVRALLTQLADDEELRGLASLARRLMAAVTLPRSVSDYEELQVGGVSDISNRGPLDRLLLSELAHDELTLAVRIAMNEALYYRRESPPRTPPRQRSVFLDCGIRSWGVPRVFSTAVALAFGATTDGQTDVRVVRAHGNVTELVDVTNRDELIRHLGVLEVESHPGAAFANFAIDEAQSESAAEPVLVTTEDVLEDEEFQCRLADCALPAFHVATVNREGRFQLWEYTARGRKLQRTAQLDLQVLFEETSVSKPELVERDWARGLPAIFHVQPFPLLLSHNIDLSRTWCAGQHGVFSVANDRRLMFWDNPRQGARQIADNVPSGTIFWHSTAREWNPIVHAVIGQECERGLHLLTIDRTRGVCDVKRLNNKRSVRAVCDHNGALFVVYARQVQVFSLITGDLIQTLELPAGSHSWQHGRICQFSPDRWYALSYDGRTARLELVLDSSTTDCPVLRTMFERDGVDGPIGVTDDGDLYWTSTREVRQVEHDLTIDRLGHIYVRDVERGGGRIILASRDRRVLSEHTTASIRHEMGPVVIDVDTLQVTPTQFATRTFERAGVAEFARPTHLRHRFTHLCRDREGLLALVSRKDERFAFDLNSDGSLRLKRIPWFELGRHTLAFRQLPQKIPAIGYRLWTAQFSHGEAFLDSRGLLHLRSMDTTVPEVTIVLCDSELSGWCADGRVFGTRYFIGDRPSADVRRIYEETIQDFVERWS